MEDLNGDDVIHMYMRRLVDGTHASLTNLLVYSIFIIKDNADKFIGCDFGDERMPVEWTEKQMLLHLSLTDGALLH